MEKDVEGAGSRSERCVVDETIGQSCAAVPRRPKSFDMITTLNERPEKLPMPPLSQKKRHAADTGANTTTIQEWAQRGFTSSSR